MTRLAEAVAKQTGCTVSQPVWFGSHPYHRIGMPRTVPVDEDTFTAYLSSVIVGFWNTGFRKQILLNQKLLDAADLDELTRRAAAFIEQVKKGRGLS